MASKRQQTFAKRARELAVKEKRELKRAKKAARAAEGEGLPVDGEITEDADAETVDTPLAKTDD